MRVSNGFWEHCGVSKMLPSQSLRKQDKNRGRSPTKKAECTTGYLFNLQSPMIQSITFFISFLACQNLIINPECGRESASKNTKILSVPKKFKPVLRCCGLTHKRLLFHSLPSTVPIWTDKDELNMWVVQKNARVNHVLDYEQVFSGHIYLLKKAHAL